MDKSLFKFTTSVQVRNFEIDWQGIVHNAIYLLYFETGRIEYLKHLGVKVDINSIQNESKVVLVRNEIDYRSPAKFDDVLSLYTRVSFIKNTSFGFEGILEHLSSGRVIAENRAIHVWLDPITDEPVPVGDHFRRLVQEYEGNHALIAKGS